MSAEYIKKYHNPYDNHVEYLYKCSSCGLNYKTRALIRKPVPICHKCNAYEYNVKYVEDDRQKQFEKGKQEAFREVINHYVSEDYAEFENWLLKQIEVDE